MCGHLSRNQENGNMFHQVLASGILTYSLLQQFEIHNENERLLEDAEKYAYAFADRLPQDHFLYYNTVIDRLRVAVAKNNHDDAELYYNMIMSQESHGVKPTHIADARRAMEKLEVTPLSRKLF